MPADAPRRATAGARSLAVRVWSPVMPRPGPRARILATLATSLSAPLLLAACPLLAACSHARLPPGTAERPTIRTIDLGIANAHVVYGRHPILVDTGPPSAADDLADALNDLGIERGALSLIVLTHGHADHAGGAPRIRHEWFAPILAGKGDVPMLRAGENRPLVPANFTGYLIAPFVDDPFEPFSPDITLESELDLAPYGVEGKVIAAPGHTPGALYVLLRSGDALVGDLLAGGWWGGVLFPTSPGTHYFHDDEPAAERHICAVIRRGAKRLFLGHGGPVSARDAWDRFCENERLRRPPPRRHDSTKSRSFP